MCTVGKWMCFFFSFHCGVIAKLPKNEHTKMTTEGEEAVKAVKEEEDEKKNQQEVTTTSTIVSAIHNNYTGIKMIVCKAHALEIFNANKKAIE